MLASSPLQPFSQAATTLGSMQETDGSPQQPLDARMQQAGCAVTPEQAPRHEQSVIEAVEDMVKEVREETAVLNDVLAYATQHEGHVNISDIAHKHHMHPVMVRNLLMHKHVDMIHPHVGRPHVLSDVAEARVVAIVAKLIDQGVYMRHQDIQLIAKYEFIFEHFDAMKQNELPMPAFCENWLHGLKSRHPTLQSALEAMYAKAEHAGENEPHHYNLRDREFLKLKKRHRDHPEEVDEDVYRAIAAFHKFDDDITNMLIERYFAVDHTHDHHYHPAHRVRLSEEAVATTDATPSSSSAVEQSPAVSAAPAEVIAQTNTEV